MTTPLDDVLARMRRDGLQWPHDVPRLLAAVDALLALHKKGEPIRSWDLDLRCSRHNPAKNAIKTFDEVRNCLDCSYRDIYECSHCRRPSAEWPCPTVQAITRALTGKES